MESPFSLVVPCLSPVSWDPLLNKSPTWHGSLSQVLFWGELVLRHHHVPSTVINYLILPSRGVGKLYNPGAEFCLPASHCVNQVLLEPSQAHLCTIDGSSLTTTAEVRGCNKEHMVHKTSNIYSLAL